MMAIKEDVHDQTKTCKINTYLHVKSTITSKGMIQRNFYKITFQFVHSMMKFVVLLKAYMQILVIHYMNSSFFV